MNKLETMFELDTIWAYFKAQYFKEYAKCKDIKMSSKRFLKGAW